jgi:hypothetical protein
MAAQPQFLVSIYQIIRELPILKEKILKSIIQDYTQVERKRKSATTIMWRDMNRLTAVIGSY